MPHSASKFAPFVHVADHQAWGDLVQEFKLPNGLRVLCQVDKSAPVVSYFTWYRVGSRHERKGKTGLAHFFEHLMFNETETHAAGEFDRLLEASGAESNAATWFDWTYYYESVPKDRLGLVIKLEAERMHRLVLREPQVASELEVVANERRYRVDDDVEGAANEELYKLAFEHHAYHAPTIGWMDDIQSYTPADCAEFYRMYYAPNNATVVVVGDVTVSSVLKSIAASYGPLTPSVIPPDDIVPEPPQLAERRLVLRKPTATAKLVIGYPCPALGDADHAALTVLGEVLFGGRASRIIDALVTDQELASDVRGWVATFRHPGLFELYLTARPGIPPAQLETALEPLIRAACTDLVTEAELERAKARLELGLLQSIETMAGKAEQLGFYDTVLDNPLGAQERLRAYLRVTSSDLRFAARRYLRSAARNVIEIHPDSTGAVAADSVATAAPAGAQ